MADYVSTVREENPNSMGYDRGVLAAADRTLSVETPYSSTDLAVEQAETEKAKWTYLVYMAADNDLCHAALYDIVSMQQARIDPEIEIYILVDRTPVGSKDSGDYVTPTAHTSGIPSGPKHASARSPTAPV